MSEYPKTPVLDSMIAVKEQSALLGEFVDYLSENGMAICDQTDGEPIYGQQGYLPIRKSFEQLFADFFDIDLKAAEAERVAILDHIRNPT